ncbi:unnamed protein product [Linum trigynum]|uniref:F-box domain-containing protein n=1 Tax=Linum trigynum TaxID=586398 RepID=A0AAV2CU22_9ROSI
MRSISKRTSTANAAEGTTRNCHTALQVPDSSISPSIRTTEAESEVEYSEFPLDVVVGVLSRLPVKALFRFKSVSTNWDAMIPCDPYLVSLHLKNYTNNPATTYSLLCNYLEHSLKTLHIAADQFHFPPMINDPSVLGDYSLLESGGLFLLANPYRRRPDYSLWNPST